MDVIERNQQPTQKTITNPQLTAILTVVAASVAGPPLTQNLTENDPQPIVVNVPDTNAQPAIDVKPFQDAQDRLRDDLIGIVTQSSKNVSDALEGQSAILIKHDKKLDQLYKWADHITDKVNEIGTTQTQSVIYSEPYYQTSSTNCDQQFSSSTSPQNCGRQVSQQFTTCN